MSDSPALRAERLFVSHLRRAEALNSLDIVPASDRDVRVPPTHAFVACDSAVAINGRGYLFRCVGRVVFAANFDDIKTEERGAYVSAIRKALDDHTDWADEDAKLLGWVIKDQTEDSDGDQVGDVFHLVFGMAYVP